MGRELGRRQFLQTGALTAGTHLLNGAQRWGPTRNDETWPQYGYDTRNSGHAPDNTGPTDPVERLWSYPTDTAVRMAPAVVGDTVYTGTFGGPLYALSASDAVGQWSLDVSGTDAVPAVADGSVYAVKTSVSDGVLYGLSGDDGHERWQFRLGSATSPTVGEGSVYVGTTNGQLYAISTAEGRELWSLDLPAAVQTVPAVADGTVYVGTDRVGGGVYAVSADDGSVQWLFDHDDHVRGGLAVANDRVFVVAEDAPGNRLFALSADDGTRAWSFDPGLRTGPPAVADGTVYVPGEDGLYALSARDGTEQWFYGEAWTTGRPTIVDGTVYLTNGSNVLYAVDAGDGTERWTVSNQEANFISPPVVAGGRVYVGTDSGVEAWGSGPRTPTPTRTTTRARTTTEPRTTTATDPPTETSVGTDTSTQTETGVRDGRGRSDILPVALGLLGLGGIGGVAWWVTRRRRDGDGPASPGGSEAGDNDGSLSADVARSEPHRDSAASNDAPFPDGPGPTPTGSTADRRVPTEIPRGPDVSVDYERLTDRELIGRGGTADVYRATLDTPEGPRTIAVKEPRFQDTVPTDAVDSFLQEAETWAKLDDHEGIIDVVDYGAQPLPWIAMEYMDAGDLGDRAGVLDLEQAVWTALSITRAVRHAHTLGVAHLDLTPSNVLFTTTGAETWDAPKIGDWGFAKTLLTHSTSVEGLSPAYAAPEQFDEEFGPTDQTTDIYQLGTILYELFTGDPVVSGSSARAMNEVLTEDPVPPSAVNPAVPGTVDEIVLPALAKRKADRYEDVLYMRDRLQKLYDSL